VFTTVKNPLTPTQFNVACRQIKYLAILLLIGLLGGCAVAPDRSSQHTKGVTVCDSYLVLSMCLQDFDGDNTVDLIFFTDTKEIFMYQEGKQDLVGEVMPFHRCAVPLNADMQTTTNRILKREALSFAEEIGITKALIASYVSAKPTIDACNAEFEDNVSTNKQPEVDFSQFEDDWEPK